MSKRAGFRLPFTWHGPQDSPVLVFGNSLGTTQWMWHHQIANFSEKFRILTFELPGHFEYDGVWPAFTIDDMVSAVSDLLDRERVRSVIWCGISFGGSLGVLLAARRPDLISRLVVVNAPLKQTSRDFWLVRADSAETKGLGQFANAIKPRWFPRMPESGDPEDVQELARQLSALPVSRYAAACRALANLDVSQEALMVLAPTVVISGEDDQSVPPENSHGLRDLIPLAELRTLAHGGHLLPVELPEEFNAIVDGIISINTNIEKRAQ